MVSYNYKWTIDYMCNLDFYDFLKFYKKTVEREENKVIIELRKLQLLTQAIHTSEPNKFIEEINNMLNNEPSSELVGDLDELEKLKRQREAYVKGGDIVAGK